MYMYIMNTISHKSQITNILSDYQTNECAETKTLKLTLNNGLGIVKCYLL